MVATNAALFVEGSIDYVCHNKTATGEHELQNDPPEW